MNNKILRKIVGIAGYKLIDKQLHKNNKIISENTFLTSSNFIKKLISKNKINKIIQIGANDGKRFDILHTFIKKYKINSLLVEPIKSNFYKLKKNYKNLNFVKLDNSAITINKEILSLFKVDEKYFNKYGNHIPGITSFEINHLKKHGVNKRHIVKEKITSITIKDLLKKYKINNFDLLYTDTEGYDGKIVIDFLKNSSIRPIIILEYIHINHDIFKTLIKKLQNNNYAFFSINENLICLPKKIMKIF